ncbi:MAG: hypothetical protein H6838_16110 [Planctomycetes bacterium]|nr:hypothetical protein [Planctomycetota bacterium]
MNRSLLLLLTVAAIALGWWALRGAGGVPPLPAPPAERASVDEGGGATVGTSPDDSLSKDASSAVARTAVAERAEEDHPADVRLRVLLLDARDRPVPGVEVGVATYLANDWPTGDLAHVSAVVTDSEGRAQFDHVQEWLRGAASPAERGIATWRVAAKVTGSTDLGAAFDPGALPTEPIVLRWPGAGRLHVRLVHLGKTLTEHVSFGVYRGDPGNVLVRHAAQRVRPEADGWALFPRVALGGALHIAGWCGNGSVVHTVDAPVVDGQELRVELSTDDSYVLCGTLLDQGGKPLVDASVRMTYGFDQGGGGSTGFSTDAAGRWLYIVRAGSAQPLALKQLTLSWKQPHGAPLTVSAPPRELRRGTTDLGVLQFAPAPLVVAGRFAFDAPALAAAVRFEVEALRETASLRRPEWWQCVNDLAIASDQDGTFEVRGMVTATRHRLVFRGQDHLPIAPIEFVVGTHDLVVPVSAGHGLRVAVQLPEGLPPDKVLGLLVPQGQAATTERMVMEDPRQVRAVAGDPAQLIWKAQAAGRYSLCILVDAAQAPIVTLDDVVLPLPEGGDGRLQLDLRQRLRPLRLAVDRPAECQQALVFALPQQDASAWRGAYVHHAEVVLVLPAETKELFVLGGGCEPQRVPCPGPQASVRLLPWPKVELRLDGLPALPPGFAYQVGIAPEPNERERAFVADYGAGTIDGMLRVPSKLVATPGDRAELQVRVGANRLVVNVGEIGGRFSVPLDRVEPAEIHGGRDLAPIRVSASAEVVAAAIERLRKVPGAVK